MAKKNSKTAEKKTVEKELEVNEFTEETVVEQPKKVKLEAADEVIETAETEKGEELYKTSDYTELERVLGREKTLTGDIYYGYKRK